MQGEEPGNATTCHIFPGSPSSPPRDDLGQLTHLPAGPVALQVAAAFTAAACSGGASTGLLIYSWLSQGMLWVINHAGGTESPVLGIQRT